MGCDGSHRHCGYGDHPGTECDPSECSSCAIGIPANTFRTRENDTFGPGIYWCLDCGHTACRSEGKLAAEARAKLEDASLRSCRQCRRNGLQQGVNVGPDGLCAGCRASRKTEAT